MLHPLMSKPLTIYTNINLDASQAKSELDYLSRLARMGITDALTVAEKRWSTKKGKKKFEIEFEKVGDTAPMELFDKTELSVGKKLLKMQDDALSKNENALTTLRQQVNTRKQLRDGLDKYITQSKQTGQQVRVLNQEWVKHNDKVKEASYKIARLHGNFMQMAKIKMPWIDKLMTLGNAFNQITMIIQSVMVVIQALGGAIGGMVARQKQIEGMKLSFEGFGLSAEQANQVLVRSKMISLQYGASLAGIEKAFKRITPAVILAGGSLEDAAMIVESLAARTATLGLNTEQTGRYIEAFAQVMGKGKLQSEELNQQFSELDGALRGQIAAYLKSKHGIVDLEASMREGIVTAGLFREAFVAISEEMRDNLRGELNQIQRRIDTLNVQQIQNIIGTLNTITLESLNKTFGGFGAAMLRTQVILAQFAASVTTSFSGLNAVVKGLMDALGLLVEFGVGILAVAIKVVLVVIEALIQGLAWLGEQIMKIPGMDQLVDSTVAGARAIYDGFRFVIDEFLDWGDAIDSSVEKLSQLNGELLILKNKQADGVALTAEQVQRMKELEEQAELTGLALTIALKQEVAKSLAQDIEKGQEALKKIQPVADALSRRYEHQKAILLQMKKAAQDRADAEIEGLEKVKTKLESQIEAEKSRHEKAQAAIEAKYDYESSRLDEINQKRMDGLQMELDALQAKTPAEEELAKLRKQELQAKLHSKDLTRRERLEVEAQLQRMERQEQIAQKQAQIAKERKKQEEAKENLQKRQNAELEKENQLHDKNKGSLEDQLTTIEGKIKKITGKQDEYNKKIDKTIEKIELKQKGLDEIPDSLDDQISKVEETAASYQLIIDQVDNIKTGIDDAIIKLGQMMKDIEAAKAAKAELESESEGSPDSKNRNSRRGTGTKGNDGERFAGGSVRGGGTYTVNELGPEGFLSASGRLSAINAPAYGDWRAPGAGTVIPAHIWSEMNASGASAAASGAAAVARGVNASGGIGRALKGLMGGSSDRITNNVTIQAANTVQAASDMMVQLNKIRRRRMG